MHIRESLKGREGLLEDHPNKLFSRYNYVVILQSDKDYAAAKKLSIDVLEKRNRTLGLDYLDTLSSKH